MRKIPVHYPRLAVWVFLVALLAACGSKATTTTTSNANPSFIYVHSVAFKSGSLYAWGANAYGQLGNNDLTGASQFSPIQISSATFTNANVAGVSAGATHTLAFKNDVNKTVWGWGNNGFGQVGNNSPTISWTPVPVVTDTSGTALTGITAVSAGWAHSLALDSSKQVWAWGDNTYGELGGDPVTLTLLYRYFAGKVYNQLNTPFNNIMKIAAGGAHNLALDSGGTVWSWGNNDSGQLGLSTSNQATKSPTPNSVTKEDHSLLSPVVAIAAGGAHSLFILIDGTVWACGHNLMGQLGQGGVDTTDRKLGAVLVTGLPTGVGFTPIAVAAGRDHSLVLMDGGSVWAWGYNFSVGNGVVPTADAAVTTPGQVKVDATHFLTGVTKIVAIGDHSLAVNGTTGQLWAWGVNSFGQLGQGGSDATNRYFATPVPGFSTGSDLYAP